MFFRDNDLNVNEETSAYHYQFAFHRALIEMYNGERPLGGNYSSCGASHHPGYSTCHVLGRQTTQGHRHYGCDCSYSCICRRKARLS